MNKISFYQLKYPNASEKTKASLDCLNVALIFRRTKPSHFQYATLKLTLCCWNTECLPGFEHLKSSVP